MAVDNELAQKTFELFFPLIEVEAQALLLSTCFTSFAWQQDQPTAAMLLQDDLGLFKITPVWHHQGLRWGYVSSCCHDFILPQKLSCCNTCGKPLPRRTPELSFAHEFKDEEVMFTRLAKARTEAGGEPLMAIMEAENTLQFMKLWESSLQYYSLTYAKDRLEELKAQQKINRREQAVLAQRLREKS